MAAGLRQEEVCQIINLKKALDQVEVLIQYAARYRRLGWHLVAVNFKGETALELDFSQPQRVWADKLTSLGLEGIRVNLGVRTGARSRLLVLEVHREESLPPFNHRGEWCSGCVAEAGLEREQHYYTLPKGWQPPASFFLESHNVMVFGEGGMVLVPPSLEPRAHANLRWLRPPWESPPTRPSPELCRFIREQAPSLPQAPVPPEPEMVPWAEIYPAISPHPEVLQALLAPAASAELYYQHLLHAARKAGLEDPQMLLSLLWHAPLGNSHSHPRRLEYLHGLVQRTLAGAATDLEKSPCRPTGEASSPEGTEKPARSQRRSGMPLPERSGPPGVTAAGEGYPAAAAAASPPAVEAAASSLHREFSPTWNEVYEAWSEMCRFSRDNLIVERRRYEAMIYELGKLGALHDYFKKEKRENKALRQKLESQWTRELDYLRQLVVKKSRKGWYRSWWQV